MKVFVIGFGGCEYVIVWKLVQLFKLQMVYVVLGNGGMVFSLYLKNVVIIDVKVLVDFVQVEKIGFIVVGFEVLLVVGVVDEFCVCGLCIFGFIKVVVQFESFKVFVKDFMKCYVIFMVVYEIFFDVVMVYVYVDKVGVFIVIKVDGLVVGKGVVVVMLFVEVYEVVDWMLVSDVKDNKFGV